MKAAVKNVRGKSLRRDASAEISSLRTKIAALPVVQPKTFWTAYYAANFPEFFPSERWTSKHHSILQVLSEIKPRSVLDQDPIVAGISAGGTSWCESDRGGQRRAFVK